ncbi:hypothetical protein P3T27_005522 [Kitasatospora sp. MAA19]|uniref:hypothetical protein n=1 Tax=Kitasatospora sp. MAA19 TaxID=3035090 RepID=UPI002476C3A3|nr:hypothetical protein [Kitasatospora sp. MAA19]MDH6708776.1 hypothetical protein [Kitasatospora sp. MAA19]
MSTTRRTVLSGALAAPLLARFTGSAADATPNDDDTWGTISDGWVEIRWTPQAQAQLDRFEATVEAIAPARLVKDSQGVALRFPLRSGAGDPSPTDLPQAQGNGLLDGGVTVRTPTVRLQVTSLNGTLQDGQAFGTCVVNGVDVGMRSVFRCGLTEGALAADPAPPGRPLTLRLSGAPLRPSGEALEAFASAFGEAAFTADTVLAHVTAEGRYTPPKQGTASREPREVTASSEPRAVNHE